MAAVASWLALLLLLAPVTAGALHPLSCSQLKEQLQAHGLSLPASTDAASEEDGWPEDGWPSHCTGILSGRSMGSSQDSGEALLSWNITVRLHKQLLLQEAQRLKQQHMDIWELAERHPTPAGIFLSNLLCLPRLTLLWRWMSVRAARSPAPNSAREPASELASLHLAQHLLLSGVDASEPRRTLMHAARAMGWAPDLEGVPSPLSAGSIWFWLAWALCPGLLVAHCTILSSAHRPLFVLYVAILGMLRTGLEGWTLMLVLSKGRLTRADKVDSWVCSHVLPTAVNVVLAAVQAVCTPLMPRLLLRAVFWVRCLSLPWLSIWALLASWSPAIATAMLVRQSSERQRRGRVHHPLARPRSPDEEPEKKQAHWPPALQVPATVDDGSYPEAFRCPITLCFMREPTQSTSGMTYERSAIVQWLELHRHDPVTHTSLRKRHISPNLHLRQLQEEWLASNGIV